MLKPNPFQIKIKKFLNLTWIRHTQNERNLRRADKVLAIENQK